MLKVCSRKGNHITNAPKQNAFGENFEYLLITKLYSQHFSVSPFFPKNVC